MHAQRVLFPARWLAAAAALAGIVIVYQRWLHVNPTTVALTLLLFILFLAAKWGLRYAVVASIAATACYNYFFLPPVRTFTINDPQNWLALLAFLATAVIASRMSARIREEASEARTRQRELEMLFHLSRELLQTDRVAELINAVPESIARVSHASEVILYLEEGDRVYRAGGAVIAPPDVAALRDLTSLSSASRLDNGQQFAVPVRTGVRPRGVLLVRHASLSEETLEAMGGLVSIAIDRAQALEDITRGEAAKESERLRGVMLDSITHELRTPLTSIKAAVTTLLSSRPVNAVDSRELLTIVDEESDRLNHLVAQAVEMAQLDTREIHMRIESQSVDELLDGLADACGGLAATREITTSIPPGLPKVLADPIWIRKVLCSLLDNAAKYSAAGQPIAVSAGKQEEMVSISVADQGIGIDPLEQPMIFDKFYRARSLPQRVPGTGMGLAICRAILEAHHGSIHVTSQLGRGSVFTFALPISP